MEVEKISHNGLIIFDKHGDVVNEFNRFGIPFGKCILLEKDLFFLEPIDVGGMIVPLERNFEIKYFDLYIIKVLFAVAVIVSVVLLLIEVIW